MEQEYRFVSPHFVVCLGAIPAQALIGRGFRIGEGRGAWHEGRGGIPTTATYHPAYVLRLKGEDRARIENLMVDDFRMAAESLAAERE
jgi:DNA polymerase